MRFVFTGGPGAGKTTALEALSASGYICVPETARKLIRSRLNSGMSPRPDPIEFAENILEADIANYQDLPTMRETSFFDRGIVDALCMLEQCHAISEYEIKEILRKYPYNSTVFLFPPWKAIYNTDGERDQSHAEAVHVYESLRSWYRNCGYCAVDVPIGDVRLRVDFILNSIIAASSH